MYHVVYDGNCNLCVNLVKFLEQLDRGERFRYVPMQNHTTLAQLQITPADCELGMILVNAEDPTSRWQGSAAAEEIGRLLPLGQPFVELYRSLPGVQWAGDRLYEQVRDNRYSLFGQRQSTYHSSYPAAVCDSEHCHF